MRSRAARLISIASVLLAIGGAAAFLLTTERTIAARRSVLRSFDLHAREAVSALADARSAQQAYVASGQSTAVWMPKVSALTQEVSATVDALRGWATSDPARQALLEASSEITEFRNVDKRVRDYLSDRASLMASDIVYSEGGAAAVRAGQQVEAARLDEHQAAEGDEASRRRLETYAVGGATAWVLLMLVALSRRHESPRVDASTLSLAMASNDAEGAVLSKSSEHPAQPDGRTTPTIEALQSTAALCTDMARMRDVSDLQAVLGRVARLLEARGLVVWLGDAAGSDLRPLATCGYPDHVLALLGPVPRLADNAAAAAYRTGLPQVVAAGANGAPGAIAVPILAAEGCVGALTAEVRTGRESSSDLQALAAIVSAQLASALAPPVAADVAFPEQRTASA